MARSIPGYINPERRLSGNIYADRYGPSGLSGNVLRDLMRQFYLAIRGDRGRAAG